MKSQSNPTRSPSREESPDEPARAMARQVCMGFMAHDRGHHEEAVKAFEFVDRLQFRHVDRHNIHLAARAFVDALWAKDTLELQYLREGELDEESLRRADWSPVRKKFRQRAAALGLDQEYAVLKTEAWRRHKTGGDYWSPFQEAQLMELRTALQNPEYPEKPKEGQSGLGPEAARYALAVELHDMHTPKHWRQAEQTMVPYFEKIVSSYDHE